MSKPDNYIGLIAAEEGGYDDISYHTYMMTQGVVRTPKGLKMVWAGNTPERPFGYDLLRYVFNTHEAAQAFVEKFSSYSNVGGEIGIMRYEEEDKTYTRYYVNHDVLTEEMQPKYLSIKQQEADYAAFNAADPYKNWPGGRLRVRMPMSNEPENLSVIDKFISGEAEPEPGSWNEATLENYRRNYGFAPAPSTVTDCAAEVTPLQKSLDLGGVFEVDYRRGEVSIVNSERRMFKPSPADGALEEFNASLTLGAALRPFADPMFGYPHQTSMAGIVAKEPQEPLTLEKMQRAIEEVQRLMPKEPAQFVVFSVDEMPEDQELTLSRFRDYLDWDRPMGLNLHTPERKAEYERIAAEMKAIAQNHNIKIYTAKAMTDESGRPTGPATARVYPSRTRSAHIFEVEQPQDATSIIAALSNKEDVMLELVQQKSRTSQNPSDFSFSMNFDSMDEPTFSDEEIRVAEETNPARRNDRQWEAVDEAQRRRRENGTKITTPPKGSDGE